MPEISPENFRSAMSLMPTGVTIVTAVGADGPAGATANAVSSLSIEPRLMLACLDRGSRTLLAAQACNGFGINVLAADQEHVARSFSTKAPIHEKWTDIVWRERGGLPAIDGSMIWLVCELIDVIAGGDHVILTGEVKEVEARSEAEPLLYHRAAYRTLG